MRRIIILAGLLLIASSAIAQFNTTSAKWDSSTAIDSVIGVRIGGQPSVCVSLTGAGTVTAGSANFELSDDGGTTWYDANMAFAGTSHLVKSASLGGAMKHVYCASPGAATHFQARLNPAITGSGSVTVRTQLGGAPAGASAGLPPRWACSLDAIGATLTQCQAAPAAGSGLRLYLTDVVVGSTTATGGQYLIRYGTGTNCATGTTSLFPSAATVVRFGYPASTASPLQVQLATPIPAPAENALCILCVATNTCTVQMSGYAAP